MCNLTAAHMNTYTWCGPRPLAIYTLFLTSHELQIKLYNLLQTSRTHISMQLEGRTYQLCIPHLTCRSYMICCSCCPQLNRIPYLICMPYMIYWDEWPRGELQHYYAVTYFKLLIIITFIQNYWCFILI